MPAPEAGARSTASGRLTLHTLPRQSKGIVGDFVQFIGDRPNLVKVHPASAPGKLGAGNRRSEKPHVVAVTGNAKICVPVVA